MLFTISFPLQFLPYLIQIIQLKDDLLMYSDQRNMDISFDFGEYTNTKADYKKRYSNRTFLFIFDTFQ